MSGRRRNNFISQQYQQPAYQQQQAYQQQAFQQQAAEAEYQAKLAAYEIEKRQYAEQVAQAKAATIQATMPLKQVPQGTQVQVQQQVQYTPQYNATQQLAQIQLQMQIKKPEKTWFQKNGAYLFAILFLILAIVSGVLCYLQVRKYNSASKNNNNLYLIYTFAIGASIFLLFAIILFIKKSMHSK